jgi:hypothetical protein
MTEPGGATVKGPFLAFLIIGLFGFVSDFGFRASDFLSPAGSRPAAPVFTRAGI